MGDRLFRAAMAAAVMLCFAVAGCQERETSLKPAESGVLPEVVTASETTRSPLPYREYVLPAGGSLYGYSERMACLLEPISAQTDISAIRILDLESGENQRVVEGAVNAERGFEILSVRCSDEWLVWEEMTGDCFEDPLSVEWYLYALELDGSAPVGEPLQITGSVASAQSRPLFSVVGSSVYWMTNSASNARQEGTIDQSRVWTCELPGGEPRTLYQTSADAFSFSAQPGALLLTRAIERNGDPAKLVVLDPGSGAVLEEVQLRNEGWLSHYTSYREGACAWSVGDDDGVLAGDFFLRDPGGDVTLVAKGANDSVFVGDYLFYEHKPMVAAGTASRTQHWRVCALDTHTMEYFVVFDEEARAFGWAAPIGVAPQRDRYVMFRSVPPWTTEEEPGTWVRVYTVE